MDRSNSTPTDADETNQSGNSSGLSRRNILRGAAATGALLAGAGTVSANGQGGQAVVFERDFKKDESFVIRTVDDCDDPANPDGSCEDQRLPFQCNGEGGRTPDGKGGKGGVLAFPYWYFNYVTELEQEDDPAPRKIYTRDNSIRPGSTYRWPGNEKYCPDNRDSPGVPENLVQTGFVQDD